MGITQRLGRPGAGVGSERPGAGSQSGGVRAAPQTIVLGQRPRGGFDKLVATSVPLADRQPELCALAGGNRAHVRLRREPDFVESSEARMTIAVTGVWHDGRGVVHVGDLGDVPAPVAREIARAYPDSDLDGSIDCVFLPAPGRCAGVRISVWASEPSPRLPCRACANWLPPHAAYCPMCGLARATHPAVARLARPGGTGS
jgi:hypothetical protein